MARGGVVTSGRDHLRTRGKRTSQSLLRALDARDQRALALG